MTYHQDFAHLLLGIKNRYRFSRSDHDEMVHKSSEVQDSMCDRRRSTSRNLSNDSICHETMETFILLLVELTNEQSDMRITHSRFSILMQTVRTTSQRTMSIRSISNTELKTISMDDEEMVAR